MSPSLALGTSKWQAQRSTSSDLQVDVGALGLVFSLAGMQPEFEDQEALLWTFWPAV